MSGGFMELMEGMEKGITFETRGERWSSVVVFPKSESPRSPMRLQGKALLHVLNPSTPLTT